MAQPARTVEVTERPKSPVPLKLVPPADLLQRGEQLYAKIARRAFELFESNGRTVGHDLEDWFKAESEMLHPVRVDVSESEREVTVRADVPGFAAKELEVSAEPRKITITGRRETKDERKEKKTVYTERSCNEILRTVELPVAVETENTEATLKDGVLELKMRKAAPPKKVEITAKETKPDEQC